MRVLVANTGSSSLKLSVIDGGVTVARHDVERWDGSVDGLRSFATSADAGALDAVGHRVVHGGSRFTGATRVDDDVLAGIEALTSLAPTHQPRALAAIRAGLAALPDVAAYACFDTALHHDLPAAAATYAVPAPWRDDLGVRRYGFHGLSHGWAAAQAAARLGRDDLRVVSAHLGSGASLCALAGGRSVDTTMGLTPLEGLVMGTRSGTVDPGLVLWLQRTHGLGADEVDDALQHRSGLLGLCGRDDVRDVIAGADAGDEPCRLALDVYVHRIRSGVAAMVASLGGIDALVFTGGVGQHSARIRDQVCAGLGFLGPAVAAPLVVEAREDLQVAAEVAAAHG